LPDSHLQIDLVGSVSTPLPRASKWRAAHNSIFFLFPAFLGSIRPTRRCFHPASGTSRAGPHCQRTSFEGTKKPIGWGYQSKHRDRHPVSRPPSLVAAREAIAPLPPQSIHFLNFFRVFLQPRKALEKTRISSAWRGRITRKNRGCGSSRGGLSWSDDHACPRFSRHASFFAPRRPRAGCFPRSRPVLRARQLACQ